MSHKNDYSCIVFGAFGVFKMQYVHDLHRFSKWLDSSKFRDWKYFNVYDRRTGEYLRRFYNGNYIPRFLN
ncbi:hypothetical protein [Ornithobacterium rhinotracheale]|uniref:Uncharacterized protein n=1 Tax=Ornithobacterium rhinotracheale (strain ATCC 51463 / DSM 15997 / CCUG 23171 / CIP 104009 / LMG 9086) TaxID=867902 RepID=I4A153_ORNRL|nr:hypothetical protein [Ornithobacterium rhinotracheale]AFL97687.1 hypothetical protein Ornrh_1521 [Ornithobacterium rhinotracheale DSM 15997]